MILGGGRFFFAVSPLSPHQTAAQPIDICCCRHTPADIGSGAAAAGADNRIDVERIPRVYPTSNARSELAGGNGPAGS